MKTPPKTSANLERTRIPRDGYLFALLIMGLFILNGCGRSQLEADHRHLIKALRTAVSAKNVQWLEQSAEKLRREHEAGRLSDEGHALLHRVIADARGGDWQAASSELKKLARAQRPTSTDLERAGVRSRHRH